MSSRGRSRTRQTLVARGGPASKKSALGVLRPASVGHVGVSLIGRFPALASIPDVVPLRLAVVPPHPAVAPQRPRLAARQPVDDTERAIDAYYYRLYTPTLHLTTFTTI